MMRHIIQPPTTKESILKTLEQVNNKITRDFSQFSASEFQQRQGMNWSPAEHLRHLNKCVKALAKGLGMPGLLLKMRFGSAGRPSRPYEQVRDAYLASLEKNPDAGSWAATIDSPEQPEDAFQKALIAEWEECWRHMNQMLQKWSEKKLDSLQVPHPKIGKLTIREMLFFTIYHNAHHGNRVLERAGKTGKTTLSRFGD